VKVVLAGGSGALGRRLAADLQGRGHEVVVLTRRLRPSPFRQVAWDGRTLGRWASELASRANPSLPWALEAMVRTPGPPWYEYQCFGPSGFRSLKQSNT